MEWEKAEQLLESLPEEKLEGFFLELPHSDVADLLGLVVREGVGDVYVQSGHGGPRGAQRGGGCSSRGVVL